MHLEGCDVTITGLVRSTGVGHALPTNPANHCNSAGHPSGSTACVEILAHGTLTITGTVHADLSSGEDQRSWVDLISRGALSITGGAGFAVHANSGGNGAKGGQITVLSTLGSVTTAGNAIQANATAAGQSGGSVTVGAGGTDVTLGTSIIEARGATGGGGTQAGGQISVRSYNGAVTGGPASVGVTNLNAGGGPPLGSVTLQACTGVSYTGSTSPTPFGNPGNQCGGAPMADFSPCTGCVGSLDVDKVVVGDADGASFTIVVDCTRDEFDDTLTFNASGVLTGGGPLPITGIPAGTQCTVTETGTGGATSVSYSPGGSNPPTVTIVAAQTTTVTVTNSFLGSLEVNKVVVGDALVGTTFTINVSCPSASINVNLTFDADGNLSPPGQTNPITGIPVGTECTVNETGTGGASSVTYSPDPPTVTITADETPVTVTVTNSFLGSLEVDKVVQGEPAGSATFTINVSCPSASIDENLTFDADGNLDPPGQTNPITGIPVGTQCTVNETGTGGADTVTYSPDPPTVTITQGPRR